MTHIVSTLASPAGTGFLSLWRGSEVFDSSVVRCSCDKPVLNSSRFKVPFKRIVTFFPFGVQAPQWALKAMLGV